jgi:bacillithiol biosynthesis cysteine-adding enzyme BshC
MSIRIHPMPLDSTRLVRDYLNGSETLAPFFSGRPGELESFSRQAEAVAARFTAGDRRLAAEAIRTTSPASRERLERVVEDGGFFVTTGQQPGLFGGPLFTLYKALTAVRLAHTLEDALDVPVAPLFWVASEDHDLDEANHTALIESQHELVLLRIHGREPTDPQLPLYIEKLGDQVEEALGTLDASTPPTASKAVLLELLRSHYRPGRTVARAFTDLLEVLLAPFDLLLVDAHHPALKALSAPILLRELERQEEHETRLREQTQRLLDAGYHAQVEVADRTANVSLLSSQGRDRLVQTGAETFVTRRAGESFGLDELRALMEREPARFSPNVLLRPVVESSVFPVLAYVAGPGEIAYFAQLRGLFQAYSMEPPLIYPRWSGLLIEPKISKVLDKFGLEPKAFRRPLPELERDLLEDQVPPQLQAVLQRLRASVADGYDGIRSEAAKIDPTLQGFVSGQLKATLSALRNTEKKILKHLRDRNAIALGQLAKTRVHLFPDGRPQERVLNVFPYLFRYDYELLRSIAQAIEVPFFGRKKISSGHAGTVR